MTDRYFTKIPLANELLKIKVHLTGTVMPNRKYLQAAINTLTAAHILRGLPTAPTQIFYYAIFYYDEILFTADKVGCIIMWVSPVTPRGAVDHFCDYQFFQTAVLQLLSSYSDFLVLFSASYSQVSAFVILCHFT